MIKNMHLFFLVFLCACGGDTVETEKTERISPFSSFNWGDNFNTVMDKLCKLDTSSISINFKSSNKADICKEGVFDLNDFLVADLDDFPSRFETDFMTHMKRTFENKNIFYAQNLSISAKSVFIKGVEYKLVLGFKEDDERTIKGAVLSQSSAPTTYLFKNAEYTIPLFLNTLALYPVDKAIAEANRDIIYNLLHSKFDSYSGINQQLLESKMISVQSQGTSILFDGKSIEYSGVQFTQNKFRTTFKNHLASNVSTTNKDSSSGI